ncbi:hypothetical protein CK203_022304 [Vitis vinifera]|uniref:Uncharacterized protein n=1 Tax=Vitis vinifera TaxID=29760 RepID=A0A438I906_VITVI|nr:hypothetical protein CK203_022304 [Vitis vinifera]
MGAAVPNFTWVRQETSAKLRVTFPTMMALEEPWLPPAHHLLTQPSFSMRKNRGRLVQLLVLSIWKLLLLMK